MTVAAFAILITASPCLFPQLGRDFFPQVDAGQMRLHVRAPPGTRLEKTQCNTLPRLETEIRRLVWRRSKSNVMLDNLGTALGGQRHQHRPERLRHRGPDGR